MRPAVLGRQPAALCPVIAVDAALQADLAALHVEALAGRGPNHDSFQDAIVLRGVENSRKAGLELGAREMLNHDVHLRDPAR